MANKPWLKKAPEYFQDFYANDFAHLEKKVDQTINTQRRWIIPLLMGQLFAIIAGAIAIICTG